MKKKDEIHLKFPNGVTQETLNEYYKEQEEFGKFMMDLCHNVFKDIDMEEENDDKSIS